MYAAAAPGALRASAASHWYNAACSYALAGNVHDAVDALDQAVEAGLGMMLLGLHKTPTSRDSILTRSGPGLITRMRANREAWNAQHANPDSVRIVTEDIARFWAAYDVAAQDTARATQADAYARLYLTPGTEGLLAYVAAKIGGADNLARRVAQRRRYYDSVRPQSLALASAEADIRNGMRRFQQLYPEATFPDVYLLVGALTSGGTSLPPGLTIGSELYSITEDTPLDEIGGMAAFARQSDALPLIVVHELIHANQNWNGPPTLLRIAIAEGGADFLSELAMESTVEPIYRTWGRAHERQVWDRFMAEKDGSDWSDWSGNSGVDRGDWVGDLGYYVGYEIARGYYDQAADKRQAVRDLLRMEDPQAILATSGYADRFTQDD